MKKLAFEFNDEDERLLEEIKRKLEQERGQMSYMAVIRQLLRNPLVERHQ